ncbi:MAG: hypothetical protein Q8R29_00085 [bacterium]|nr:hypothetical protein [bacterium]
MSRAGRVFLPLAEKSEANSEKNSSLGNFYVSPRGVAEKPVVTVVVVSEIRIPEGTRDNDKRDKEE